MTETLIECGVNVVGRTRYCIHPQESVRNMPIVGGTKKINVHELLAQKPDLIVLDKEENTKETAEILSSHGCKTHVMHVDSLDGLVQELLELSVVLRQVQIEHLSTRLKIVLQSRGCDFRKGFLKLSLLEKNPFMSDCLLMLPKKVNYVIWKKPWMLIGKNTYIDDVLHFAGFECAHSLIGKYPQRDDLDTNEVHLFSSEPYPFLREWDDLQKSHPRSLLVDGEKISWFGLRSLLFLEDVVRSER